MKTTATKIMMSLVLSVSMMMAVTASAQTMTGRTRPGTTSANTSAAVSSQRNTGSTSKVSSAASSGTTRTTVSSTRSSGSTTVATRSGGTGKVSSSSTSTVSTTRPSISTSKASQGSTTSVATRSGNNTGKSSTSVSSTTGSVRNGRSGGSGTTVSGTSGKGNTGGNNGGKGQGGDRPNVGGQGSGYGPGNAHNYNGHPNANQFSWNHSHRDWSRPIAPPARNYRPVFHSWRRPAIPSGYVYYSNAPVIDRIFGITFGSRMSISLDLLYSNGYFIDGYTDKVVYLRDIEMYDLLWDDAMLSYDGGLLKGVQLSSSTSVIDRTRFNMVYHRLSALYGTPVRVSDTEVTWFGSRGAGYITLSADYSAGRYYTTLWIGN